METHREFLPDADRYIFDLGDCSIAKGWAQVDTDQDAWYYGTWANPTARKVCTFAEGDVTVETAETDAEFVEMLRAIKTWNDEQGHGFKGIDPGLSAEAIEKWKSIGLGDLLH